MTIPLSSPWIPSRVPKQRRRRYYHASPRRLRVGQVLLPCRADGSRYVYLTNAPAPHYTIAEQARTEGWHIYEVRPLARTSYGSDYGEWGTSSAEIVRYVGNAAGIGRTGEVSAV